MTLFSMCSRYNPPPRVYYPPLPHATNQKLPETVLFVSQLLSEFKTFPFKFATINYRIFVIFCANFPTTFADWLQLAFTHLSLRFHWVSRDTNKFARAQERTIQIHGNAREGSCQCFRAKCTTKSEFLRIIRGFLLRRVKECSTISDKEKICF